MHLSKPYVAAVSLALLAAGVLVGRYVGTRPDEASVIQHVREDSNEHSFISPLLYVTVPESTLPRYLALKEKIGQYARAAVQKDKATDLSVYVRDLNSSQWIGFEPDKEYSAASMLKVVTLVATLRAAESDPSLLTKRVHISEGFPEQNPQDFYPPENPLKVGSVYTVQQILNQLIIESDNAANYALYGLVGREAIKKTYEDLQLPFDEDGKEDEIDTAHDYSHLFRTLYNSTYLSRTYSEKVLDLLSRTKFQDGLEAGVPQGTVVSHKFGQRSAQPPSGAKELHDCGVVYYPDHPYFICVMTRGSDYPTLASVIADISRLTWEQYDAGLER